MIKTIGNLISRLYHDLTRSKEMISFSDLNTKSGTNIKKRFETKVKNILRYHRDRQIKIARKQNSFCRRTLETVVNLGKRA